jgi:glycosyltransferase involved in cell wall biosynthesis
LKPETNAVPIDPLEFWLVLTYLFLGPVAWGFYLFAMYLGRKRMMLMERAPGGGPVVPDVPGEKPVVTVLIPAKDEGERIRTCILSAIKQDYPRVEVIAIDDRSTDNTGAVMDEMAREHPNLRVLHITEPPEQGWTGKNNALHQGSKIATGQWLLFVDSDVVLQPDVLTIALAVVRRKQFGMLSLLPALESGSLWESLMVPLCAGTAGTMYLISMNNIGEYKGGAFANGQFMLMRRDAYDQIGGHVTVRDRYCEDVAIAKLFKEQGLRPRVSWGTDFCSVRMYSSLSAVIRGWSRIYYAAKVGSPWRILAAIFWVIFCSFSVIPAFAWGVYRVGHPVEASFGSVTASWLAGSIVHFLLMTTALAITYRWSRNPVWNSLLFLPMAGPMLLYILCRALKMCVTKKVEWRGTAYSHAMASKIGPAAAK